MVTVPRRSVPPGFTTRAVEWLRHPGGDIAAIFPLIPFDGSQECVGDDRYTQEHDLTDEDLRDMQGQCALCGWLDECRDFALAHERFNYYAGMTESERDRMRLRMRLRFVDRADPGRQGLVG